jgi:hypothetical protein
MRHLMRATLCLLMLLMLTPASAQKRKRKAAKPPGPGVKISVLRWEPERVMRGHASVLYTEEIIDARVALPDVYLQGDGHINLNVESTFYIHVDPAPDTVRIEFQVSSTKALFAGEPLLTADVNGERVEVGRLKLSPDDGPAGGVIKRLWVFADYPIYKRIAGGKEVKFKFGKVEIDLNENQLDSLRDIYRALEAGTPDAPTRKF